MKIIVTGGSGFIGSHLVERLVKEKHNVVVIDNFSIGKVKNLDKIKKKIIIIKKDITKLADDEKIFKNTDCIFHLAALADIVPSIENPKKYFEVNVDGTFKVLSLARKYNIKRFVYSASSSCYGIPKKFPTAENCKMSPQYPYALTKRLGEELVLHFAKVYKLNATSLRFFNVYGPRARTSGTYGAVFGVFLAQKLAKLPLTIVGNGKQKRDFTYVSDVVDALIKVSKHKKLRGEVFNVGSGRTVSINKIVKLLKCKKIYIPKRPGEPEITFANIKKIKKQVQWRPKISVEEGVQNLLNEIHLWKDAPVWSKIKIKKATRLWFKYLKNE
jgi:UDP-glucose 4-epimerase